MNEIKRDKITSDLLKILETAVNVKGEGEKPEFTFVIPRKDKNLNGYFAVKSTLNVLDNCFYSSLHIECIIDNVSILRHGLSFVDSTDIYIKIIKLLQKIQETETANHDNSVLSLFK